MEKLKESNITYIINSITTDPKKIELSTFCVMCLSEGVFKEFYIHYPLFKDMIMLHNQNINA